jgi:Winged helix-turn-helix DNA-binding
MSVLDQVRDLERKMLGRLRELEPLMREYEQLRKAAQKLGVKYTPAGDGETGERRSPRARRTTSRSTAGAGQAKAAAAKRGAGAARSASRSRKTAATQTTAGRTAGASRQGARGRRTATAPGQRQEEVLRVVSENPGIKVSEIGKRLGVDSTGLYRVVRRLTEEERVRKEGAQLYPAERRTAEPAAPTESTSAQAAADVAAAESKGADAAR